MIKDIKICTNCGQRFPHECDGKLYFIVEWGERRKLCKGEMTKDGTYRIIGGKPHYHFVRGYGEEWDTPLIEIK